MAKIKTVKVYDPANPWSPVEVASQNFDPRSHARWENRPAAALVDWAEVEGVSKTSADALERAGVRSLEGLMTAQFRKGGVPGTSKSSEAALAKWVESHPAREEVVFADEEFADEEPDPQPGETSGDPQGDVGEVPGDGGLLDGDGGGADGDGD